MLDIWIIPAFGLVRCFPTGFISDPILTSRSCCHPWDIFLLELVLYIGNAEKPDYCTKFSKNKYFLINNYTFQLNSFEFQGTTRGVETPRLKNSGLAISKRGVKHIYIYLNILPKPVILHVCICSYSSHFYTHLFLVQLLQLFLKNEQSLHHSWGLTPWNYLPGNIKSVKRWRLSALILSLNLQDFKLGFCFFSLSIGSPRSSTVVYFLSSLPCFEENSCIDYFIYFCCCCFFNHMDLGDCCDEQPNAEKLLQDQLIRLMKACCSHSQWD